MKKFIFILFISLFTTYTLANEVTKMAKIEILLKKTNSESLLNGIYLQVNKVLNTVGKAMKVKPSEKVVIQKFEKRLQKLLEKKASWNQLKKPLKEIYSKNFTEKEIVDIISFYETPTGKKLVKISPKITIQTMQANQRILQDMLPEMQKIATQFKKELIVYRKKQSK